MTSRVLIVGGSRGIGRQVAVDFAKNGATVGITYQLNDDAAQSVAEEIRSAGGAFAGSWKFNASVESESAENYDQIKEHLGGIDVLVHCSGITWDKTFRRWITSSG